MDRYSISFTLGKASEAHGANLAHNNRRFTARNVTESRTEQNVTYKREYIEDAYDQLFAQAVADYNAKQTQPCRRIQDYYEHIKNSKREEAFYEVVVQFGDMETAGCGTQRGEAARQMLDEYMREFQKRNPNLYVFNAVLHMDEASPHLHIDFIPFYTQGRTNGLQKGVSMKAALNEMGFRAKGQRANRLVAWEERERAEMESILHRRGYRREDKNAHHAHMTVAEYKHKQSLKTAVATVRAVRNVELESTEISKVRQLQTALQTLERKNNVMEQERRSPYKAFFYSSHEKQAWVLQRLEELDIPYRETDNGFEAQECYVETVRKLEKEYKAPRTAYRDRLREDIDRLLMQSKSSNELFEKLEAEGYTVKYGKYIAVKPKDSGSYIRLKSLGEHYTEFALRNRIAAKLKFEREIAQHIENLKKIKAPNYELIRMVQLYTVTFGKNRLPVCRRDQSKPLSWTNDAELDKLLQLNQKIKAGATLESLRNDFAEKEKICGQKSEKLSAEQARLKKFLEMQLKLEIIFDGRKSAAFSMEQARQILQEYPEINSANWKNVDRLVADQQAKVQAASSECDQAEKDLRDAAGLVDTMEKIENGSFVQELVLEEDKRRLFSGMLPNGTLWGTGAIT